MTTTKTTTRERIKRITDEEREKQWGHYRAIVKREVDGEPDPADADAAIDYLELLGLANRDRAQALFEDHVRVRSDAMKVVSEIERLRKSVKDQQRQIVALDRPADLKKAKTLDDQVEMIKGKTTGMKVLQHGLYVDNGALIRAELKLEGMVRDYMNLLKDLGPTE